jgi:hypothetical protein
MPQALTGTAGYRRQSGLGLDALTARRAALTGVSLDLAWTSIPAFERIYGAARRARQVLPPARTDAPISGAARGRVLAAEAGLFENVLVLDFRSASARRSCGRFTSTRSPTRATRSSRDRVTSRTPEPDQGRGPCRSTTETS